MKKPTTYTVAFRRKRNNATNYRKRLKILSSRKARLVVRRSLKNIHASIVEYNEKGDVIKVAAHSTQLKKLGWNYSGANMSAAYLVGYLLGKKAKAAKVDEAILDVGFHKTIPGSKIYAVLAGVLDAGVQVPHGEEVLPAEDRIKGTHVAEYSKSLKENAEAHKKQFSNYEKNNLDPSQITQKFDEVKGKIDSQ